MDGRTVIFVLVAVMCLFLFFIAGYDLGRHWLVADIDGYGCERVIEIYHKTH